MGHQLPLSPVTTRLRYLFAAHPRAMGKVLGIVYRAISTHLIHKAGFSLKEGATGAVTLIQRFGWYGTPAALNLNIHFHILFLDGVYVYRDNQPPRFQRVKAPDKSELEELIQLISQRVGRCLERQGLLEQDTESAWLDLDPAGDTDAMPQILGSSSWRGLVTPAKRGKGAKRLPNKEVASPAERHAAMTWAQRLKRVFSIDIEVCGRCGGSVRVIACIEDQDVIDRILTHLHRKEQETPTRPLLTPPTRAPPGTLPHFARKGAR